VLKDIQKDEFIEHTQVEHNILNHKDDQKSLNYVRAMIEKQESLLKVLRLLCLYSNTHGGVPEASYTDFRKEIIQTYGFESMLLLNNLDKLGYICTGGGDHESWPELARKLELHDKSFLNFTKDKKLTDIHATYNGYMPMSIALVKRALSGEKIGWDGMEDILETLPGPYKAKQQIGALGMLHSLDDIYNDRCETRQKAGFDFLYWWCNLCRD
jgi:hypothetical protein